MNDRPVDTTDWRRTPRGKLICPECGLTGWPGGTWIDKHAEHVTCECGKTVTARGLNAHRRSHPSVTYDDYLELVREQVEDGLGFQQVLTVSQDCESVDILGGPVWTGPLGAIVGEACNGDRVIVSAGWADDGGVWVRVDRFNDAGHVSSVTV